MGSQDPDYEKYDHAQAIRQQIKHVNHLISSVDTEDRESYNRYFSKAFMGVATLQAMLDPFTEKEWDHDLKEVNPKNQKKGEGLGLIIDTFTEMMNFMHQENLFYATRTGRRDV